MRHGKGARTNCSAHPPAYQRRSSLGSSQFYSSALSGPTFDWTTVKSLRQRSTYLSLRKAPLVQPGFAGPHLRNSGAHAPLWSKQGQNEVDHRADDDRRPLSRAPAVRPRSTACAGTHASQHISTAASGHHVCALVPGYTTQRASWHRQKASGEASKHRRARAAASGPEVAARRGKERLFPLQRHVLGFVTVVCPFL